MRFLRMVRRDNVTQLQIGGNCIATHDITSIKTGTVLNYLWLNVEA